MNIGHLIFIGIGFVIVLAILLDKRSRRRTSYRSYQQSPVAQRGTRAQMPYPQYEVQPLRPAPQQKTTNSYPQIVRGFIKGNTAEVFCPFCGQLHYHPKTHVDFYGYGVAGYAAEAGCHRGRYVIQPVN